MDTKDILLQLRTQKGLSQEQLADAAHDDELTREERCVLCLDMAQRGIGSNSCGPELPACYEIADHIQWQVMLDPLAE